MHRNKTVNNCINYYMFLILSEFIKLKIMSARRIAVFSLAYIEWFIYSYYFLSKHNRKVILFLLNNY